VRCPEQCPVSPEGDDQIPRLLGHWLGAVSEDCTRTELAKRFLGASKSLLMNLVLFEEAFHGDIVVVDELLEPLLVASGVPLIRAFLVYDEDSGAHSLLSAASAGAGA
jgi:hypothetical protein